jgi:hypothetical protein
VEAPAQRLVEKGNGPVRAIHRPKHDDSKCSPCPVMTGSGFS